MKVHGLVSLYKRTVVGALVQSDKYAAGHRVSAPRAANDHTVKSIFIRHGLKFVYHSHDQLALYESYHVVICFAAVVTRLINIVLCSKCCI